MRPALYDGFRINYAIRFLKGGRTKVWHNPTQAKLDALVKRYGAKSIEVGLGFNGLDLAK